MKKIKKIAKAVTLISACAGVAALIDDRKKAKTRTSGHRSNGPYESYIKRPLDAFLSTGALIVLSPVMLTTAALVRLKLGSPVLFTQDRPGLDEKVFKLYKFRTMTDARDAEGNLLPDEERLTSFGKLLRSTSLDELPELLNIIKGDMAIIGPRPLLVKYLPRYNETQRRRHEVRPGLTGLAMSTVRNSAGWDKKFELDVEYVDKIYFLLDLKIIFWTARIVLKREGINEEGNVTNSEFMGILEEKE
jgi:lipopolysaccharide/colanic/teichoic acid biosynthesis glycosyltransferase